MTNPSTGPGPSRLRQPGDSAEGAVVGVIDGSAGDQPAAVGRLALATTLAELQARLGSALQAYTLGTEPAETGVAGEVALVWGRAASMEQGPGPAPIGAESLGPQPVALVVIGDPGLSGDARTAIDRFSVRDGRVDVVAAGNPALDPMSVAWRLFDEAEVKDRVEYLKAAGRRPPGPYLVCQVAPDDADTIREVEAAAEHMGLAVARIEPGLEPSDLVALVAGADLIVSDSPSLAALAVGQLRPTILAGPSGGAADPAGGMAVARFSGEIRPLVGRLVGSVVDRRERDRLSQAADLAFDRLALGLRTELATRAEQSPAEVIAELRERVDALEAVNAHLRKRLQSDRRTLAEHLRQDPAEAAAHHDAVAQAAVQAALHRETEARAAAEQQPAVLREEVARIYSTRTMRALQPARSLYARLRSTLR